MRARRLQEAFTRSILPFWNQENQLRAAKDKRHLLSCSMFIIVCLVCSWDPIIAGFREKFLRFKTRKWRRQFVFFRRCHRWVSRATVVVKSETAGINVIFAFSQRWVFHYSIWPIARESSSLFFVGFIVVVEEIYTSVAWTYNHCFLQLAHCCFSCTTIPKLFSHFLKASTSYGYFHYASYDIFAHWFSLNQMFKFSVSFATEVEKKTDHRMNVLIEVFARQKT